MVLSGRFKDILGAFGGRFDGEIAVGVSADDTVDHVVIVIGMMVKQTILHTPASRASATAAASLQCPRPRRVFILRRSVMGVVDEQVDAVGQFEGRSPVRVIEVLHVRDVGHRAVAVIEAETEGGHTRGVVDTTGGDRGGADAEGFLIDIGRRHGSADASKKFGTGQ